MSVRVWGCARHAQIGRSCCQDTEILVTDGDRARIAAHTGTDDFLEVRPADDASYELDADDPVWALGFHPDGSRPVLRHQANGHCRFLGAAGCMLPMDTRPIVCRLFPYEYDASGITGVSTRCPAEVVRPGNTIVDELDMDRKVADAWHAQLYDELRAAPRRPPSAG